MNKVDLETKYTIKKPPMGIGDGLSSVPCWSHASLHVLVGKEHGPIINGLGSQSQIKEAGSWLVTLFHQWLFSLKVN
jgi:hypothetical protein